jgi:hypothetical protein
MQVETEDVTVEVSPTRMVVLALMLDTGAGEAGPELSVEMTPETACAFGEMLCRVAALAQQPVAEVAPPGSVQRRG